MSAMDHSARIYVAGHHGMAGSALVRRLGDRGRHNLVTCSRSELDLTDQGAVEKFFREQDIDVVLLRQRSEAYGLITLIQQTSSI
jgi:GDP-L-fucose synthase